MRDMDITSNEEAKAKGWKIIVPFPGEVVGKAVYKEAEDAGRELSIMKSTKRLRVPGGSIYNTSTEIHKERRVSIAEALVFVPDSTK